MNKEQAVALCEALGLSPFAPVGKVERWQAIVSATSEPKPAEPTKDTNAKN